ncbi:MAG: hypothetical protein Q7T45_16240 [Bradyrhizobium sp.]|uniref:hypothetical protein n=1 Tax=Bradyrhizobium sp. TaxID=376 RepID=UPI00271B1965|nr:hypothetical protein [Bradyrhizobium sp.]MDO8399362.1 hypothetical protein [Bradyrhizobium sp.]
MTKHRTITGFVAVALLAAAASVATMRSPSTDRAIPGVASLKVLTADENGLQTQGPESARHATKKSVRYEAIIANWKRYRSATKSNE